MGAFIEERMKTSVLIGAQYEDSFSVDVTTTTNGARYTSLKHELPMRVFDVSYVEPGTDFSKSIASLYYRTYGGFAGFRVRARNDYSTAPDGVSPYSATDEVLTKKTAATFQLMKTYGVGDLSLPSIGRPRRIIRKPVSGKVAVSIEGSTPTASQWSVDTTTGIITFASKSSTITGITLGASTVIDTINTFSVGESVAFDGIVGTVELNGMRATITARTSGSITVDIVSSLFTPYVSGGTVQWEPLSSEDVSGGCEFDIPAAFDSPLPISSIGHDIFDASTLRIVELLNP